MQRARASKRRTLIGRFGLNKAEQIIRETLNGNIDNLIGITKDNRLVTKGV